jgi:hypothetical protein
MECYVLGFSGPEAEPAIQETASILPGIVLDADQIDPKDDPAYHDRVAGAVVEHIRLWKMMPQTGLSDVSEGLPLVLFIQGMTARIAHIIRAEVQVPVGMIAVGADVPASFDSLGVPTKTLPGGDDADHVTKVLAAIDSFTDVWDDERRA